MTYIEKNLRPGERIIMQTNICGWSLWGPMVFGTLLIPVYGIGLGILLISGCIWNCTELAVTNKRVVYKRGVMSCDVVEIPLGKVESCECKQGLFGMWLGFGTVFIRGTGRQKIKAARFNDAVRFCSAVNEEM